MPNPDKKFKKHKVVKTPGKNKTRIILKKKTSNHKCAVCKKTLHGMPHGKRVFEVKRLSKTQRRPENLLASVLCPECRQVTYQEAVFLKNNLKLEKDIDLKYLKYVNMILKKIE